MKCPCADDWDLLAMEALEGERAEGMREHARTCPTCRKRFRAARRAHIDRVRMYEAFDHDHDELREQLMAAVPEGLPRRSGAVRLVRGWARLGDYVMSLNTTAGRRAAIILAPAACIVLAVVLFLSVDTGVAFAQVVERIRQTTTVACRVTTEASGGLLIPRVTGKMYVSAEHGSRFDLHLNDTVLSTQYYPREGPIVSVNPLNRTYMRMTVTEEAQRDPTQRSPDAWIRELWKLAGDAADRLDVGQSEAGDAVGFKIAGEKLGIPGGGGELWVDARTRLPVRLVVRMPGPEPGSQLTSAYDQFEWDLPLDAALFEPHVPQDYRGIDVQLPPATEQALLDGLRSFAEWTDGRYPADLNMARAVGELQATLMFKRNVHQGPDDPDDLAFQELMQDAVVIGGACMYYRQLVVQGRQPEYFGDSVTRDDVAEILLRWKLDDGRVRVIYGDLRVETRQGSE
jgi:hypothetical protein